MTEQLGSAQRPVRVAIVGAGPSGFYAAGSLLQQKDHQVTVDMFDRLPAPFGLVRYGVAPDHQKIKSVTKVYERTAADPRFRFFGNVGYGTDIKLTDLHDYYDQIVFAVGANSDRRLGVPGEDLAGSLSATEFVAWYNGHPDYVDLDIDLSIETAIVVGVGNVAMDVARILAKTVDELKETDITDHALEVLATSKVKDIYIMARRGPAQVKFTQAEVKEFGELTDADPVVDAADLELDPLSAAEIANDTGAQKNLEVLRQYAEEKPSGKSRRVHFTFLRSPVEIFDNGNGHVGAVKVERNVLSATDSGYLNSVGTGETYTIPAGMILRSVGYKGSPMPDLPYNSRSGVIPNKEGRIVNPETGTPRPGEYVVGWAKRGPTGIIGTNKPDAGDTVDRMLKDLSSLPAADKPDPAAVEALLHSRNVRFVTIADWKVLDQLEIAAGAPQHRPRVKLTRIADMLDALTKHVQQAG